MFVISLSYKTSSSDFRERLVLDEEKRLTLFSLLRENELREAVYVATCNRCEIYGVGNARKAAALWASLAQVDYERFKESLLYYEDANAIEHLFRVSAGLESMVLGEDEILRQVKESYAWSKQRGYTAYELNMIFQGAFCCAKKIKTETLLSKSAVSVASLAATKIHHFKKEKKKVLVIGASGDTGRKLIKNLFTYGDSEIYATKHQSHIDGSQLHVIPYEERYLYLDEMDVIVSATKGPHLTITYGKAKEVLKHKKERLFVDLAVPRDFDEDLEKIKDCQMISIDDFRQIAKENNKRKIREKLQGEMLLELEIDRLRKELLFREARTVLFPKELEQREKNSGIQSFVYQFKEAASAVEFEGFINVLKRIQEEVL